MFLRYTSHRSLVVHFYCSQCALSANTANPCCICFLFPACVCLSAPSCCCCSVLCTPRACWPAVLSCVRPRAGGGSPAAQAGRQRHGILHTRQDVHVQSAERAGHDASHILLDIGAIIRLDSWTLSLIELPNVIYGDVVSK